MGLGLIIWVLAVFPQSALGAKSVVRAHRVAQTGGGASKVAVGAGKNGVVRKVSVDSTGMPLQVKDHALSEIEAAGSIPVSYGRFDVPVNLSIASGASSSWTRINAKTAIGLTFGDYPAATQFRACISFTDSGSHSSELRVRLRRTDAAGGTTFYEDAHRNTWSGSGLIHNQCGSWREISSVSCGQSWGNTCQLDLYHTQGSALAVFGYDFEVRGLSDAVANEGRAYLGRFDISVTHSGVASNSWTRVNSKTAVGFNMGDYPSASEFRACVAFTDSGSHAGAMKIRLRRISSAGVAWMIMEARNPVL